MYGQAPDIKELAEEIIEVKEDLFHIRDYEVGFLCSDTEKKANGCLVYADCTKTNGLLKYYSGFDFIITIYEPNVMDLTDGQLQVLLYHELLHIGEDGKLRQHTVQDFHEIIYQYSLDWIEDDSLEPIVGGDKIEGRKKRKR